MLCSVVGSFADKADDEVAAAAGAVLASVLRYGLSSEEVT